MGIISAPNSLNTLESSTFSIFFNIFVIFVSFFFRDVTIDLRALIELFNLNSKSSELLFSDNSFFNSFTCDFASDSFSVFSSNDVCTLLNSCTSSSFSSFSFSSSSAWRLKISSILSSETSPAIKGTSS